MSFHVPERYRAAKGFGPWGSSKADGNNGVFLVPNLYEKRPLRVIASDGGGWEHVSISKRGACPVWREMCFIKGLFWDDEDVVVQYHPAKSEYVNCHPNCLHLWRPTEEKMPTPPTWMVGPISSEPECPGPASPEPGGPQS